MARADRVRTAAGPDAAWPEGFAAWRGRGIPLALPYGLALVAAPWLDL